MILIYIRLVKQHPVVGRNRIIFFCHLTQVLKPNLLKTMLTATLFLLKLKKLKIHVSTIVHHVVYRYLSSLKLKYVKAGQQSH